jgi:hypothetical protein
MALLRCAISVLEDLRQFFHSTCNMEEVSKDHGVLFKLRIGTVNTGRQRHERWACWQLYYVATCFVRQVCYLIIRNWRKVSLSRAFGKHSPQNTNAGRDSNWHFSNTKKCQWPLSEGFPSNRASCMIINSVERSLPSEDNSCSPSQEIINVLLNPKFFPTFTRARHRSWARWIQSTPTCHISLRSIIILFYHYA